MNDIYDYMNDKIKSILVKIALELKKSRWKVGQDPELTLASEGNIPLVKMITVDGAFNDDEWKDNVETHIELKIESDDQITFFPTFTIYASIFIDGGSSKDIIYKLDADANFIEKDYNDSVKITDAANKINRVTETYIEDQYTYYVNENGPEIEAYKNGGWRADVDETFYGDL
jgi:hypothetical protein